MAKFTPVIKKINTDKSPGSNPVQQGNLKKARKLLKDKKLVEALAEVELILQNNPSSFPAHLIAGRLKARQKLNEEALAHFLNVIKINPQNTQAYLRAGRIYFVLKKLDSAIKLFQGAIKQEGKNPLPYAGLAQVYLKQKKYQEAEENFLKAIRLNPRLIGARKGLALTCKEQKKYDEAISYFNSILTVDAENAGAYVGMGRIYLLQKQYSQAKEAYQKALNLKSSLKSSAYMGLVETLIESDELEEAKTILTEISGSANSNERLQKLWGDLYTRQGLYKEATEAYQAAMLINSDGAFDSEEIPEFDLLEEMDDAQWEQLAKSYSEKTTAKLEKFREGINS